MTLAGKAHTIILSCERERQTETERQRRERERLTTERQTGGKYKDRDTRWEAGTGKVLRVLEEPLEPH